MTDPLHPGSPAGTDGERRHDGPADGSGRSPTDRLASPPGPLDQRVQLLEAVEVELRERLGGLDRG